jgi:hypothetical protein
MTPNYSVKAMLNCGTVIEVVQLTKGGNFTMKLTPPDRIPVADMADIKDNQLIIRATGESLVGVFSLLKLMIHGTDQPAPKKWYQKIL